MQLQQEREGLLAFKLSQRKTRLDMQRDGVGEMQAKQLCEREASFRIAHHRWGARLVASDLLLFMCVSRLQTVQDMISSAKSAFCIENKFRSFRLDVSASWWSR